MLSMQFRKEVGSWVALACLASSGIQAFSWDMVAVREPVDHRNCSCPAGSSCSVVVDRFLFAAALASFQTSTSSNAFLFAMFWIGRETRRLPVCCRGSLQRFDRFVLPTLRLQLSKCPAYFRGSRSTISILQREITYEWLFDDVEDSDDSLICCNFSWTLWLSSFPSDDNSLMRDRNSISWGSNSRLLSAKVLFSLIITSFSFSKGLSCVEEFINKRNHNNKGFSNYDCVYAFIKLFVVAKYFPQFVCCHEVELSRCTR